MTFESSQRDIGAFSKLKTSRSQKEECEWATLRLVVAATRLCRLEATHEILRAGTKTKLRNALHVLEARAELRRAAELFNRGE